jgi:hypothetical protein
VSESNIEKEDYVSWLQQESMLADASRISGQFSGIADVWQSPFATPNPTAVMGKSSVWFTAYPISMITKPGHSFLSTLGDEDLWRAFEATGINAVHTGPLKRAPGPRRGRWRQAAPLALLLLLVDGWGTRLPGPGGEVDIKEPVAERRREWVDGGLAEPGKPSRGCRAGSRR